MFRRNSINGSVEWLGVPDLLRTNGPPWTANILAPHPSWGYQGYSTNPNWGSGSGGYSESVSVLWNCPARDLPIYHQRVFENMCSTVRRVGYNILQENRTYRMQSPPTCRNPIRRCLVNQRYDNWGYLWDESVD